MGIPFADASEPEIVARVIYRVVQRLYTRHPSTMNSLNRAVGHIRDHYPLGAADTLFTMGLASCLCAGRDGTKVLAWRDAVVRASRAGYNVRRCFYSQYKSTRYNPPVSNTGVRGGHYSKAGSTIAVSQGDDNARIATDRNANIGHRLDNGHITEGRTKRSDVDKRRARLPRDGG